MMAGYEGCTSSFQSATAGQATLAAYVEKELSRQCFGEPT